MTSPSSPEVSGLIERLKRAKSEMDHEFWAAVGNRELRDRLEALQDEAASALSAYEGRLEALTRERDGLRAMIEGREQLASLGIDGHGTAVEVAKKFMRDRDAAEARLETARTALEEIESLPQHDLDPDARKIASAALTALEQSGEGLGSSVASRAGEGLRPFASDNQQILGKED